MELFEKLHDALRRFPPEPVRPWKPAGNAAVNQAFFEAYFSNFIEGTEFAVDEARAIVFDGVIPRNRPADAHDVLGTFELVSDPAEMGRLPQSADAFLELLRHRHRTIMAGRPELAPGDFKQQANQFGSLIFVAPEDVRGTLMEGFRIHQRLAEPLHRAIFMMFLVSEVHPFADGNGRVARVMMNAELAATQQVRVLIPIIYRSNYLSALRSLSAGAWPGTDHQDAGFRATLCRRRAVGRYECRHCRSRTHQRLRPPGGGGRPGFACAFLMRRILRRGRVESRCTAICPSSRTVWRKRGGYGSTGDEEFSFRVE